MYTKDELANLFRIAIDARMRVSGKTYAEEWIELVEAIAEKWAERDLSLRSQNSMEREFEIFTKMCSHLNFSANDYPFSDTIFSSWVMKSPNPFANAYMLGVKHQRKRHGMFSSRRAANGRRLIGATTRDRVRAEAEKHKHLTKGAAAYAIGTAINLSPDRVRKLLSELFPGDSWVASTDLTGRNSRID